MSKPHELILSWESDFSCIALEGDNINQKDVKKVLRKLTEMYSVLTEDKHFYTEENGAECYFASYLLK